MSRKTVQFKATPASPPPADPAPAAAAPGDRPEPGPGADPDAWVGAEPAAPPAEDGSVADAMMTLAQGAGAAMRAGAGLAPGTAASALQRLMSARTPAELAAIQAELARDGLRQGLEGMGEAARIWADAVAQASRRLGGKG